MKDHIPNVLIVDSIFTNDDRLRKKFCADTGCCAFHKDDSPGNTLVNAAFLETIQIKNGIIKTMGGEEVKSAWAMVLLEATATCHGTTAASGFSDASCDKKASAVKGLLEREVPSLPVVYYTHEPRVEIATDPAFKPYICLKGMNRRRLVETLLRWGRLTPEQERHLLGLGDMIVANSRTMLDVYRKAYIHADDGLPMLLLGESGTGKEVLARYIHSVSHRQDKSFVPVNVTALTPTLIESELFGHKKNAFTGAKADKDGLFKKADKGMLFLDEIGDVHREVQAKMLRAIQEKEILPVGGTVPVKADVVFISATNADLARLAMDDAFRYDLLYRINAITIAIPPLRDRKDDIVPLAKTLLNQALKSQGKQGISLTDQAQMALLSYDYPGNVRELGNIIGRLVGRAWDYEFITPDDVVAAIAEGIMPFPPARVAIQPRPKSCHSPGEMQGGLHWLVELMDRIPVDGGDEDLKGILPKIDEAYRRLMRRLAGMALARTQGHEGKLNLQGAMSYLSGKSLSGRAPASQLKRMLGLKRHEKIGAKSKKELSGMVEIWRKGLTDSGGKSK